MSAMDIQTSIKRPGLLLAQRNRRMKTGKKDLNWAFKVIEDPLEVPGCPGRLRHSKEGGGPEEGAAGAKLNRVGTVVTLQGAPDAGIELDYILQGLGGTEGFCARM